MSFKYSYTQKELPSSIVKWGSISLVAGAVLAMAGYFIGGASGVRLGFASLISFMFLLSIGLGSLFLIAIEYLAGAVWSVPFRRIAEALGILVLVSAVFAIPVLLNLSGMYEWANHEHAAHDALIQKKSAYLNTGFFYARMFGTIAILTIFYLIFRMNSEKQDKTGDQKLTKINIGLSAAFMPFFAIGLTMLAIDFMMSLEPHWFSTIYGVYYFAGSFWAAISLIAFIGVSLNEQGFLGGGVTKQHYYSLGGFMFAFTAFWTYIAFSQFMLIWYANIPEETFWFIPRMQGGWAYVSIGLIVLHFFIPFFLLIQRPSKMNPSRLKFVAVLALLVHIYDIYWLTYPTFSRLQYENSKIKMEALKTTPNFGLLEIGFILLAFGVLALVFSFNAKGRNLIPVKDPKLQRAMEFHL
jgi:hypothetical protein